MIVMMASAQSLPTGIKVAIVAILYFLSGRLGLLLAVPPGYATVIWPASGLAVGALLAHGRSLWPGILIGSFALNAVIGSAYSVQTGLDPVKLAVAAVIAAGSTAQALAARWLIGRTLGTPIELRGPRDVLVLFALAAPVSGSIAATVGVTALHLAGIVPLGDVGRNWLTWWGGDVLGIVVFLPLVLLAPGTRNAPTWRGGAMGSLPVAAILTLLLPLGLTFYAWKASSEYIHERAASVFATAVAQSEQALFHRLASYDRGLLGAVGFFKGSDRVDAGEWRTYVAAIDVSTNFPGIRGIGFISSVAPGERAAFLAGQRQDRPDFAIHPEAPDRPSFVITFIEPLAANAKALGLDIAFEDHRRQAAEMARDSGLPTVTKRVVLVQDRSRSSGFLILHPLYRTGASTGTVAERRAALLGWVYAPFVASKLLHASSGGRRELLDLRVYDGERELGDNLFFDTVASGSAAPRSAFTISKTVDVMQQKWTLVWNSTPEFERSVRGGEPVLILVGGLIFTALFGAVLFLFAHRADTVRKLVDEKTRALAEREALYRLLAENTSDMISRVSLDGTRIYTSPACRKLLGSSPEELQLSNAMADVHPDQRAAIEAQYASLARGEVDEASGVYALLRRDGSWIQAEIAWQLIRSADGTPTELVVTKRDVTMRELRDAEIRLAKEVADLAKAKAEQASEAKTAFLAMMSHEIRTPLNGVIGYTDLMLGSSDLSEENRRHAERVDASAAALLTVVNDILDFSKIEAGQVDLVLEGFSPANLVDDALSIVRASADEKGLALHLRIEGDMPAFVLGDRCRLRQVMLNFLNNAIKFTREGEVVLGVESRAAGDGMARLRFAFRDTGIGIPKAKLHLLFERFSQVDGTVQREFGGTGLGLAICRQLVVLMGGSVGVESEEGRGSTFWFALDLPLAAAPAAPLSVPAGRAAPVKRRLLLAEDVVINQELALAILRAEGHEVQLVENGADALQAVQRQDFDLVLMDVQMPGMDGITATRLIRALDGERAAIPIIALTANVLPQQVEAFREAGFTGHVGKPFKRDALIAAVARWAKGGGRGTERRPDIDRSVLDDAVALLGEEKVSSLLERLATELEARFVAPASPPDAGRLMRDAHAMIAASGGLGFVQLSTLCREVEEACKAGAETESVLHRLRALSRDTIAEIRTMRAA